MRGAHLVDKVQFIAADSNGVSDQVARQVCYRLRRGGALVRSGGAAAAAAVLASWQLGGGGEGPKCTCAHLLHPVFAQKLGGVDDLLVRVAVCHLCLADGGGAGWRQQRAGGHLVAI